MKLTSAASYALHALAYLAHTRNSPVASHVIADKCRLPERFLLKILKDLVTAGLVESSKGPFGGYVLTRQPQEISILEVVEAVDGPILPRVAFLKTPYGLLGRKCKSLCQELADGTKNKLRHTRLSELVE